MQIKKCVLCFFLYLKIKNRLWLAPAPQCICSAVWNFLLAYRNIFSSTCFHRACSKIPL